MPAESDKEGQTKPPAELSNVDKKAQQITEQLMQGCKLRNDQDLYALLHTKAKEEQLAQQGYRHHKFWDTQPVPKLTEAVTQDLVCGPIDSNTDVARILTDPDPLPGQFEWCEVDVQNEKELQEVYVLLSENYVEDDDSMFRFDYSPAFLKWVLCPPDYHPDWHCGVRVKSNRKLVAVITGIPASMRVEEQDIQVAEINFLCVHKKLRSKRLAPVLVKEVTRRVNLRGVWQAVYTAGVVLPRPVGQCRYWHRSLNPKKLIDVGFSHLSARMTLSRTIKMFALVPEPKIPGIRALEEKDVPAVTKILSAYLSNPRFKLKPVLNEEEVSHWLLPREDVIYSFVVETPGTGEVTDLCSFYSLPSSILGNSKYTTLKAAYSYWNVANSVSWKALMEDCLILAKLNGFDVMNALDVMDNGLFLKDLKFGIGDGNLQYYLYNWRCHSMEPHEVALVLH
eukprot:Platyproteum_vivax@DN7217_c0_g1_i1.p1